MSEWIIDDESTIEFDEMVHHARIRLVAGMVDVVTTDGPARIEVTVVEGPPVTVRLQDGALRIGYDDLRWGGILGWLKHSRREARVSLALPAAAVVQLGVVSAGATVAGFTGGAEVRTVSSRVVLDDLAGGVTGETVSGDLELRAVSGRVRLTSVSGNLTVVSGAPSSFTAETVSGDITLDLVPEPAAELAARTVSGDLLVRAPLAALGHIRVTTTSGRIDSPAGSLDVQRSPGRSRGTWTGHGETSLTGSTVSGRVVLLDRTPPA